MHATESAEEHQVVLHRYIVPDNVLLKADAQVAASDRAVAGDTVSIDLCVPQGGVQCPAQHAHARALAFIMKIK